MDSIQACILRVPECMLVVVLAEILRRIIQFASAYFQQRDITCRLPRDNKLLNRPLTSIFVVLVAVVHYSGSYTRVLFEMLSLLLPYCLIIHPLCVTEGKFEAIESNSIGAGLARSFFSFVENAVPDSEQCDPLDEYRKTKDTPMYKARVLRKCVILCPSSTFLIGRIGNRPGDVRNDLEKLGQSSKEATKEEKRQLYNCRNIEKVDDLIRREDKEEKKIHLHSLVSKEYKMTGLRRAVNWSVMSWKTSTETGGRDGQKQTTETFFSLLDNRPLNVLVSWYEDKLEKVAFEDYHNQCEIYVKTLEGLIKEANLEDKVHLHRFSENLSHKESLRKLQDLV